jgi:hypothetical protein
MKDEPLYVGILEPVELRKSLLLSSKSLLTVLRNRGRFAELREQKQTLVFELKKTVDELLSLNRKLRNYLPKGVSAPVQREESVRQEVIEAPERSGLDVLEEELAKIEEKLTGLE